MSSNICPNSDNDFNKIIASLMGNSLPETRRKLFYFTCIPVRLVLFFMVYYFRNWTYMPFLLGIISFITAIRLSKSVFDPGTQWWSKRWQFFISTILFIVCVSVYFKKIDNSAMSIVLFISLAIGILQSLFIKFC